MLQKRLCALGVALIMAPGLMIMLPEGIRASALSGYGSQDNPYVVTTYDELQSLIYNKGSTVSQTCYVVLGDDISVDDNVNDHNLYLSSAYAWTVHLDLAGHSLSRTARSLNQSLFVLSANATMTIDDSVGGGSIYSKIDCGNQSSSLFGVSSNANLTINAGTFESVKGNVSSSCYCILAQGGTVVINGGTFKSDHCIVDNAYGDITINDGTFVQTKDLAVNAQPQGLYLSSNSGNTMINKAHITADGTRVAVTIGGVGIATSKYLKDHIGSNAAVTVDGERVTLGDTQEDVSGKDITIAVPSIKNVDLEVTLPKAGENVNEDMIINTSLVVAYGRENYDDKCIWYDENGNELTTADVYEEGRTYTLCVRVSKLNNYLGDKNEYTYITKDTVVTVNGEYNAVYQGKFPLNVSYNVYTVDFCIPESYKLGDINADGSIDSKDAMLSIKYAKKGAAPKDGEQFKRADVNKDGVLDTKDSMILIKAAKKLITIE